MAASNPKDGRSGRLGIKIAAFIFWGVVVPLLFFVFVEIAIRLSGLNVDFVLIPGQKIQTPIWASQDRNFFVAQDVTQRILANTLPAEAAEWLVCFRTAPDVQYKLVPNARFRVSNTVNRAELESGRKIVIASNAEGFRTKPLPRTKGKGVYRILFLGDSTTFGWGVEQAERFSDLLEERLNAASTGLRYEIINLGLPGYSSYHGRLVFERYGLAYAPDMVVLSFGANDSRVIPKAVKRMIERPSGLERVFLRLSGLKTVKLLEKILMKHRNPLKRIQNLNAAEGSEPFVTPDEFRANLKSIIDSGWDRGIETVLLPLCCPLDYLATQSALARRENISIIDGAHVLLEAVPAIQQGRFEPDLARFYESFYGKPLLESRRLLYVTSDTCHPNILGHRILAETLFNRIFKDKLNRCS